jgi:hypothetical protein
MDGNQIIRRAARIAEECEATVIVIGRRSSNVGFKGKVTRHPDPDGLCVGGMLLQIDRLDVIAICRDDEAARAVAT